MKRLRYSNDTVANVNGYDIDREVLGARVYWNALKIEDGYVVAAARDVGSKRRAIEIARADMAGDCQ